LLVVTTDGVRNAERENGDLPFVDEHALAVATGHIVRSIRRLAMNSSAR
jgi:hypothetical protein